MADDTNATPAAPVADSQQTATTPPAPAAAPATESLTPFQQALKIIQAKVAAQAVTPATASEPAVETKTEPPAADAKPPETPAAKPPDAKPDLMEQRLSKLIEEQRNTRLLKEQTESAQKALDEKSAWLKQLEEDPLTALSQRGLSYEKLTEMALDPKRSSTERKTEKTSSEVEQLRQQVAQLQQESQQAKAQAQRAGVLSKAKTIAAEGDDFEYVRTFGAEDKALALVENHFAQTGQLLGGGDLNEAIRLAMTQIEKAYESDIERGLTAKKAKSKLGAVTSSQEVAGPAANSVQRQSPKTLTNSQAGSSQPAAEPDHTDAAALRARALAILSAKRP